MHIGNICYYHYYKSFRLLTSSRCTETCGIVLTAGAHLGETAHQRQDHVCLWLRAGNRTLVLVAYTVCFWHISFLAAGAFDRVLVTDAYYGHVTVCSSKFVLYVIAC